MANTGAFTMKHNTRDQLQGYFKVITPFSLFGKSMTTKNNNAQHCRSGSRSFQGCFKVFSWSFQGHNCIFHCLEANGDKSWSLYINSQLQNSISMSK